MSLRCEGIIVLSAVSIMLAGLAGGANAWDDTPRFVGHSDTPPESENPTLATFAANNANQSGGSLNAAGDGPGPATIFTVDSRIICQEVSLC
jgi:hypothetical protein